MKRLFTALALATFLAGGAFAQQASDVVPPEAGSNVQAKPVVHAKRQMVVAANPYAAEAGLAVLRAGGSAADALIAVQAVLGLVEPQSSGLGGGGFLTWYDAAAGTLSTFDARETAPAAATPQLFMGADGKPLGFFDAVVGGRSVGVPGIPRLLETVHKRYGKKPWAETLQPAIDLSQGGFKVSARMNMSIGQDLGRLDQQPAARAYFFDAAGAPLPVGTLLVNQPYAETLKAIAAGGADAFYTGKIANRYRGRRQRPSDQPGRPKPRRSRRLPGQGAAGRLRALSRLPGLRHGPALLRRADDRPDPRHGRAVRHRRRSAQTIPRAGASSATPRASPSPTASATSPTAIS